MKTKYKKLIVRDDRGRKKAAELIDDGWSLIHIETKLCFAKRKIK